MIAVSRKCPLFTSKQNEEYTYDEYSIITNLLRLIMYLAGNKKLYTAG